MVRAWEVSAPSLHSKTERPEQSEQYLPTPVMYYYYFIIIFILRLFIIIFKMPNMCLT